MKKHLNVYCPYCGTKLLDGTKGAELNLPCKKCRTKLNVSFDNRKIYIEILKGTEAIVLRDTS